VRAAMEGGVSLVFDLYDMEVSKADWKRIVGESIRVLLYENGSHGLRHIFIEEAAEFCPQRVGPDQGRSTPRSKSSRAWAATRGSATRSSTSAPRK
jgi:hypothetical protein